MMQPTPKELTMLDMSKFDLPKETRPLRVWWVSAPPRPGFRHPVSSLAEALYVLNLLARHDLCMADLISANAGGLEVLTGSDAQNPKHWEEWRDGEGEDINAYLEFGLTPA